MAGIYRRPEEASGVRRYLQGIGRTVILLAYHPGEGDFTYHRDNQPECRASRESVFSTASKPNTVRRPAQKNADLACAISLLECGSTTTVKRLNAHRQAQITSIRRAKPIPIGTTRPTATGDRRCCRRRAQVAACRTPGRNVKPPDAQPRP